MLTTARDVLRSPRSTRELRNSGKGVPFSVDVATEPRRAPPFPLGRTPGAVLVCWIWRPELELGGCLVLGIVVFSLLGMMRSRPV